MLELLRLPCGLCVRRARGWRSDVGDPAEVRGCARDQSWRRGRGTPIIELKYKNTGADACPNELVPV